MPNYKLFDILDEVSAIAIDGIPTYVFDLDNTSDIPKYKIGLDTPFKGLSIEICEFTDQIVFATAGLFTAIDTEGNQHAIAPLMVEIFVPLRVRPSDTL